MVFSPPKSLAKVVNPQTGLSMVEAEMLAEAAASLGHHGRKVERALAALDGSEPENRRGRTRVAARAVWEYLIQREMMGMRDHRLIVREMGVPREVLNLVGSIRS